MSKDNRQQTVEKIQQAVGGKNADVLGYITYWTLAEPHITVDGMKDLFTKYGLDWDAWGLPVSRGDTAFRKALREAKSDEGRGKRYLIRPIDESDEHIMWGIVREDVDAKAEDIRTKCEVVVKYIKKTESVHVNARVKGGVAEQIGQRVVTLFDEMRDTFITWDVMRFLVRNIGREMHSISLRRGGGIFFTPPEYGDLLAKHKAVTEEIGECELAVIKVANDAGTRADIGKDARRHFEDEVKAVQEELEKWADSAPREGTMARRIEEYKELKARAETYAAMLGVKMSDIGDALDAMTASVKGMIAAIPPKAEKEKDVDEETKTAAKAAAKAAAAEVIAKRKAEIAKAAANLAPAKAPATPPAAKAPAPKVQVTPPKAPSKPAVPVKAPAAPVAKVRKTT